MNITDKISEINLRAFSKKDVAKYYSVESIQKAEETAINAVRDEIKDKKLLEIGGGKTIEWLTRISRNYTGIDYSREMVNECRRKYPDVNVLCCDARDMAIFGSEEFDFVLCAFNGMDYVSHNDRLLILGEVFRVLKKGGYFIFSTHNKKGSAFNFYISLFAPFVSHNPFRSGAFGTAGIPSSMGAFFKSIINHWKNGRYVMHTDEYSIINDKAHDYSLMTYYIEAEQQKAQLHHIGFGKTIRIYDRDGREAMNDCRDTWLYYLVQK